MRLKEYFIKYSYLCPFSTKFLLSTSKRKVIFPFYHSISNSPTVIVKHLYSEKSIEEFTDDLDFLLKYFIPISIDDFLTRKEELDSDKNNYFLLSFDDGLSSFYNIVAPILIKKNIPAINFLNTDFINNKGLFYRYKVSLLIDEIERFDINSEVLTKVEEIILNGVCGKMSILDWLQKCTIKEDEILGNIGLLLKVSFDDFLKEKKPYLTGGQIQNLINNGFEFGAHSTSHPLYSEITHEDQLDETFRSLDFLKNTLNINNNYFSFPFTDDGVSGKFFSEMENEKIITFGTSGLKEEEFKHHFQRIPMEYSENYSAKRIIRGELFYFLVKRIIGKNKTIRN
ncbi:MAG: polysaccharide deacetylase family protein [Flavobacteriaceae bacterium]|nr:polysaccharide deacetylase family protein [Flavobacteriaceae bacterium]